MTLLNETLPKNIKISAIIAGNGEVILRTFDPDFLLTRFSIVVCNEYDDNQWCSVVFQVLDQGTLF